MNKLSSVQDVDRCVNEKQNSDSVEMLQTAPCLSETAIPKDSAVSAVLPCPDPRYYEQHQFVPDLLSGAHCAFRFKSEEICREFPYVEIHDKPDALTVPTGTQECPICGHDRPHNHAEEDVRRYNFSLGVRAEGSCKWCGGTPENQLRKPNREWCTSAFHDL